MLIPLYSNFLGSFYHIGAAISRHIAKNSLPPPVRVAAVRVNAYLDLMETMPE